MRRFGLRATWVTGVSFLLVALLATGAGWLAERQVASLTNDQLRQYGIDHNREIARRTHAALLKLLAQGLPRETVLDRFRERTRVAGAFGYAVFLIDVAADRVVAHSEYLFKDNYPRPADLFRAAAGLNGGAPPAADWQGPLRATDPKGAPVLLYLLPVDPHWTVGVESGEHPLRDFERRLGDRLMFLLAATAGGIALLGFLAVRGVGRVYERALEREVRDRTSRLAAAQTEVVRQARLAAIGETAAMLTHEMRNPLASIKLGLSALTSTPGLDERRRRRMDIVLEQVDRLDALLAGTLDAVRPVRLSAEPVSLDALLDYALELLEPQIAGNGLQLKRHTCPDCPALRLDARLITQALINVLKNAIEASPPAGVIRVGLKREGACLTLTVANGGRPIPEAVLARVFEPFVSGKTMGTGLGLPMVKRVVEEHGGSVRLSSGPDSGTRCRLSLPLAAGAEPPAAKGD